MFDGIRVIGRGRVGSAIAARLGLGSDRGQTGVRPGSDRGQTGVRPGSDQGQTTDTLVLLCVPDAAIASVAREIAIGPWMAHVSGATRLAALDPHIQRFSLHPLQTFTRARGPEQLDGAWAAVTGETPAALDRGRWLAGKLGLQPFELADDRRELYHAGAAMASNYLVTLFRAAAEALTRAGAPPEALVPLMRRTIDNGFELTGPIARGDWATVDAHVDALRRDLPELEALYRALADATVPRALKE